MASNYSKSLYQDYEKTMNKLDAVMEKLTSIEKKHKKEINTLKKEFAEKEKKYLTEIYELNKTVAKQSKEITDLKAEVLRLRTNNKKDSSNSSKPSSTNGYKKVITNTRDKSQNKPGKPKGEKSTNLSNAKLQDFINSGDIEYQVIDVNKTDENKNKKYLSAKVLDIKIVKQIIEYRYFPNEDGTYDIPKNHNRSIQYGDNLKTICCVLNNEFYNSTDGIIKFISDITNKGINLVKSTVLRWNKQLAENLQPEIIQIEDTLLAAYYINCDDSSLKINGDTYNDLCVCDEEHTRLWISKKKDHNAWKEYTILDDYKGIIVKDGTDVFNGFGIAFAQCNSHILRYAKGVYDFVEHKHAKEMANFIGNCIHLRNEKKKAGIESFTEDELSELYAKFDTIFKNWKKEWMNSKPDENVAYEDERKLLARLEDEEERSQILYFLKDFNVPATNSRAEVDQRGAKIKQKIGKFRSVEGADVYSIIKSCILTYKKNNVNVMEAIIRAFRNQTVII